MSGADTRARTPATPSPAATVMLLRDGADGIQVLMVERSVKSEFLPDLYVFPGGRVDPEDHELADRVGGLERQAAADQAPGVDAGLAMGFFVAAIRETYEETGILLARRRGQKQLADPELAARLAPRRLAVQDHSVPFREIVESEDLELAADLLAAHGHWITPEPVPRRFDTLFFAALTPPGQEASHDGIESTDHVWIRPEDAVAQAKRGERRIIFPTRCNLESLCGFETAEAALQASLARPVVPVLPKVVGGKRVEIRGDAGYQSTSEKIERPPDR
jgi:8-oxo-dGTP pyrophosphatase MutT (NUDIX family)